MPKPLVQLSSQSNVSLSLVDSARVTAPVYSKERTDTATDRYWGESSPFPQLNTSNLQYLTVQQAMSDFTNFANNVQLPFDSGNTSNAASAVSGTW